jgi:AraC-like DNA-binding protein
MMAMAIMSNKQFPHLADIGFRRVAPARALRPFVQWFWYINSRGIIPIQRQEFMHPDGSMGLVFNYGDTLELGDNSSQTIILDTVSPQSQQLKLAGSIEAFGILFRPGGAFPLFGIPINELASTDVLLSSVPALRLPQLHMQLYETPSLADKVALVETWVTTLLQEMRSESPVIKPSIELITRAYGQLSIKQVAEAMSTSRRQLERLYQQQVGLSPKALARLSRVHQARGVLKQPEITTLAEIAYQCGFYDQSHFIREFKEVIGLTPGAYVARQQKRRLAATHPSASPHFS